MAAEKVSKAEYIRKHADVSAKALVEKAKSEGITLALQTIYSLRSADRKARKARTTTRAKRGRPTTKDRVEKREFVLGLPVTMPAKEVVETAKRAKISITSGYVYKIRKSSSPSTAIVKHNGSPNLPDEDQELWDVVLKMALRSGLRQFGRRLLAVAENV